MKVVFLGCTREFGFGFGANITKIGYIAKGLTEAGATCVIHNGILGSGKIMNDQTVEHDGYKVTTLRERGNSIISYIRNLRRYYKYLKKERIKGGCNIVIASRALPHILVTDWLICKMLGYKYVVISHEWSETIRTGKRSTYFVYSIYSKIFGRFANAILPISEYIIKKIEHFKKPYFKLPILAEFEENKSLVEPTRKDFVYCASIHYYRVLTIIVGAYQKYVAKGGKIKLTLVISGQDEQINDLKNEIKSQKLDNSIEVLTKLPYKELLSKYENALALIVPLNPSYEQDEARFSQKIAEYLSSRRPIITNNVGEIKYYFKDNEAIISDFSEDAFADTFEWAEKHKQECDIIGENGYRRGVTDFNYKTKGVELYKFLQIL